MSNDVSTHDDPITIEQVLRWIRAHPDEAQALLEIDPKALAAITRALVARVEYGVQTGEETLDAIGRIARDLAKIASNAAHVRAVLGEEPDVDAKPPRAGSGIALKVHYMWAKFTADMGRPALGAAAGGGAVVGIIEAAKLIWEAFK
jgi:hypothetical protein